MQANMRLNRCLAALLLLTVAGINTAAAVGSR